MSDAEVNDQQELVVEPEKKTSASRKPPVRQKEKEKTIVVLSELRKGTPNSDSVRHLQTRLRQPSAGLDKEIRPEVTGTYDGLTQRAVRAWQNGSGFTGGRGLAVSLTQAEKLFGKDFSFKQE
jgi:peptidoglycan hydrolase-like protein with peptidoglycan-binding domain